MTNSKVSSDKYKVNFSFNEQTLQKCKNLYVNEFALNGNTENKNMSTIAILAVELLYDINYILKSAGINIFQDNLSSKQIIEKLYKTLLASEIK